ncbi:FAD synthase [Sesamum alatum]|uniref:FAD synthase n=1 Tax=Sesamum alatum TaxID=300844 RepID=A0AAE2CEK9_9LAMI|nr:FAD synthase [Sesamum alatum]
MEIDEAIKESGDKRLKTKYNNAIYVIQRALALYSVEEIALSFNGGKDSTVLLHLLRAGYYLHVAGKNLSIENPGNAEITFPIRTIYFESPTVFPEINSFTYETASTYKLQMDIIRLDFKSGLEALLKAKPIRAIFLGVRSGDPTGRARTVSPPVPWMATFYESDPILDWSYSYTSIGSIHDTVPNALLCLSKSSNSEAKFKPAYLLPDGRLERAGRAKKSGTIEDRIRSVLCRKIHSIGWAVSHVAVTRNDIDSVADEVERQKSTNDKVFIYGGFGPLPSDITVAGVAKAFGARMAPSEELQEHLRRHIGEKCTADTNEMAQLPEGITELLHHEKLSLPLIKCQNVIILTATNVGELEQEWDCLIELMRSNELTVMTEAFVSKRVATSLSDAEAARPLSEISVEFPDLIIGGYRGSRRGPLIITFKGQDKERIRGAVEALCKKFHPGTLSEID